MDPKTLTLSEIQAAAAAIRGQVARTPLAPSQTLSELTGAEVWLAPAELRAALRAAQVTLETMQTGPAIRTYNIMMGERRRVAAALVAVP